jgi:glucose-1-phosphate thymidylyltransferase
MKAILLAAGYATRLYPLTLNFPKSLLPIDCVPVINTIIQKLELIPSIDEIIVVTNARFHTDFIKWQSDYAFKKKITILNDKTKTEKDKLGAIADLKFVIKKKRINDDIVVIGTDNLFDAKLGAFLKFCSQKEKICIGVFDFKKKSQVSEYGVVRLDRNKKIIEFQEKPKIPKSSLVAMCLYYFPKEKLKIIEKYLSSNQKSDALGYYIKWLVNKSEAYGYTFSGQWFDIGDKQQYFKANKTFQAITQPTIV